MLHAKSEQLIGVIMQASHEIPARSFICKAVTISDYANGIYSGRDGRDILVS